MRRVALNEIGGATGNIKAVVNFFIHFLRKEKFLGLRSAYRNYYGLSPECEDWLTHGKCGWGRRELLTPTAGTRTAGRTVPKRPTTCKSFRPLYIDLPSLAYIG